MAVRVNTQRDRQVEVGVNTQTARGTEGGKGEHTEGQVEVRMNTQRDRWR